jgi:outer membrane protein assembly factor BamB/precorrin-6B methylase 2
MRTTAPRSVAALGLAGSLMLSVAVAWRLYGPDDRPGARAPGNWPQWRGPGRNSLSAETGLLKAWPEQGPSLAWQATGIGPGVASVAVAGGRVFTLGDVSGDEQVTALEEATGKRLWQAPVGPAAAGGGLSPLMRWLSQRTPTVDGERLYAVTARGELVCLSAGDGQVLWRKDYPRDFGGRTGVWGWCDRPLVDGDRLICTPGGDKGPVVALDKKTGETIWRSEGLGDYRASYAATTVTEVGGVRQYVAFLSRGVVGIAARDGKLLWTYERIANGTANNHTPLVRGDLVVCASGYGRAMALLKVVPDKGAFRVEEAWYKPVPLQPWYDGVILVGEHIYAGAGKDLLCLDLATGNVLWQGPGAVGGAVSMASAEGRLYLLSQKGEAALIDASPQGHVLRGKLRLPEAVSKPGATAPVIAGGRLFLRDDDRLFCYEVKEGAAAAPGEKPEAARPDGPRQSASPRPPRAKGPDEPDAVFVPTPQDVVERMVELAGVRPSDTVCDLGCGDGRVVVTAARRHGCRAIGYDIDPECVRAARANVRRHGVAGLVTIEKRDIFTVDLSGVDVVLLYLSPELNERLLPQLARLRPGSRIVSHAFAIPGVPAERVVTVPSADDLVEHRVYVWTTPLPKDANGPSGR